MKTLLSLLLLTGAVWAEPRVFSASEPLQGHVVLVAEDGEKEAEALARAGLECVLSHAATADELKADWSWATKRYPMETEEHREPTGQTWVAFTRNLHLIALGNRAALAWQIKTGETGQAIFIDPKPDPAKFPQAPTEKGPFDSLANVTTQVNTTNGLPYERSLDGTKPLFLVAPETSDEVCKQLPGNVHKAGGSLAEENSAVQKEVRRWIAIQQPLPVVGLPDTQFVPSPNWGVRSVGDKIDTLVIHSTVINTLEGTKRAFLDDKERRVSAHYCVDRDGTTVQMVDERRTAWHAGVSELGGRTGVNDFSVGIELVNLNDGKDPYPEAQYEAVKRILLDLRTRWDVPNENVVSHAAIARPVGRKSDPVGFDFDKLLKMLDQ